MDVVRGAAAGTAVAHALSRVLRFVGKILYEIMLEGFLCLTKPSKRAVHGTVSPHPCVHAGVFLCSLGIISTVSKPLRYSLLQEYVCATGAPGLTSLTLWRKCCSNQFKVLDKFHKILDNRSKLVFILHRRSA